MEIPWLEKYRPQTLQDVVGNTEIIDRLRHLGETGAIPNMLFSGSPGVGKTTAALCLVRHVLGEELAKTAVLELNASDERGIDVVRGKIKSFASRKITLPQGRHKVVILDEADFITPAAQQALRRIIETHSDTTRFIFACNTSEKIIEPLQSRCAILRFNKLRESEIKDRLRVICGLESVSVTEDGVDALCFISDGDMRQAINNLQATFSGAGLVSETNVYRVCDIPNPKLIEEIVVSCRASDFGSALEKLSWLIQSGHARIDIVSSFFRVVKAMSGGAINEESRINFIREIGTTHLRILEGTDGMQLEGMVGRMCGNFK
ncbi:MAG: replication factor C subunit 4 [Amphiamblys sp. WSBS2006]|nr:MAG: replication factor C subunit 4 [Amphiamblys sp. WSBS2006]